MPRKTPVRELLGEETVPSSPLRRSSRLSNNSPVPTKVINRRNSATETATSTPKVTRGRRSSLSQEPTDEVDKKVTRSRRASLSQEQESTDEVEKKKNLSTPRAKRTSLSLNNETTAEEETSKRKPRGSSVSKDQTPDVKKPATRRRRSVSEEPEVVESPRKITRSRSGSLTKKTTSNEDAKAKSDVSTPVKKSPTDRKLEVIEETNKEADSPVAIESKTNVNKKKKTDFDLSIISETSLTEEEDGNKSSILQKSQLTNGIEKSQLDISIKEENTQLQVAPVTQPNLEVKKHDDVLAEEVKNKTDTNPPTKENDNDEMFESSLSETSFSLQLSNSILESNHENETEENLSPTNNKENVRPAKSSGIDDSECEPMDVDQSFSEITSPGKSNKKRLSNVSQKIEDVGKELEIATRVTDEFANFLTEEMKVTSSQKIIGKQVAAAISVNPENKQNGSASVEVKVDEEKKKKQHNEKIASPKITESPVTRSEVAVNVIEKIEKKTEASSPGKTPTDRKSETNLKETRKSFTAVAENIEKIQKNTEALSPEKTATDIKSVENQKQTRKSLTVAAAGEPAENVIEKIEKKTEASSPGKTLTNSKPEETRKSLTAKAENIEVIEKNSKAASPEKTVTSVENLKVSRKSLTAATDNEEVKNVIEKIEKKAEASNPEKTLADRKPEETRKSLTAMAENIEKIEKNPKATSPEKTETDIKSVENLKVTRKSLTAEEKKTDVTTKTETITENQEEKIDQPESVEEVIDKNVDAETVGNDDDIKETTTTDLNKTKETEKSESSKVPIQQIESTPTNQSLSTSVMETDTLDEEEECREDNLDNKKSPDTSLPRESCIVSPVANSSEAKRLSRSAETDQRSLDTSSSDLVENHKQIEATVSPKKLTTITAEPTLEQSEEVVDKEEENVKQEASILIEESIDTDSEKEENVPSREDLTEKNKQSPLDISTAESISSSVDASEENCLSSNRSSTSDIETVTSTNLSKEEKLDDDEGTTDLTEDDSIDETDEKDDVADEETVLVSDDDESPEESSNKIAIESNENKNKEENNENSDNETEIKVLNQSQDKVVTRNSLTDTLKRRSSFNMQETIKAGEDQNVRQQIHNVVDLFCAGIKHKDVTLNVSIEYSGQFSDDSDDENGGSTDVVGISLAASTGTEKIMETSFSGKGSKRRKICHSDEAVTEVPAEREQLNNSLQKNKTKDEVPSNVSPAKSRKNRESVESEDSEVFEKDDSECEEVFEEQVQLNNSLQKTKTTDDVPSNVSLTESRKKKKSFSVEFEDSELLSTPEDFEEKSPTKKKRKLPSTPFKSSKKDKEEYLSNTEDSDEMVEEVKAEQNTKQTSSKGRKKHTSGSDSSEQEFVNILVEELKNPVPSTPLNSSKKHKEKYLLAMDDSDEMEDQVEAEKSTKQIIPKGRKRQTSRSVSSEEVFINITQKEVASPLSKLPSPTKEKKNKKKKLNEDSEELDTDFFKPSLQPPKIYRKNSKIKLIKPFTTMKMSDWEVHIIKSKPSVD